MNDFLDRQGFALYHKKITEYIDKKDSEVMDSAGKVNDVIMNGKTIVVDKIANIDNSITAEYIIGRIGVAPVGRAESDRNGNTIDETYATVDNLKQVEAIAIGRSKSSGAENLVKLQEFLNNNYDSVEFKFGDNIFIVALDEPDLWCYGTNDITENQSLTKEQMIEALGTTEGLKLKGYTFHKLETQKVDLSNYVEKEEGKGLSENDFTDELKSAYDDHISSDHASADAEKNQNAFSSVAIDGQPTVNADSPTSTLTIKAGERVSLASDSDGRTVTINASADDIKIKNIESSGANITITFMDGSSIGFELDTSETDLVDPDAIVVGKAKDASLLSGRDGSHYLDYNNHTNAPIVNANLSDFIEPVAGTYYKNIGLTDDTFANGVIYYYDGSDYYPLPYEDNSKATKEELKASLIEMGINTVDADEISLTTATGTLASKLTVDNVNGITEPFHQMNVMVMMPSVVSSYLALSIDGGQNYHPVVTNAGDSFGNYTNNTTAEKSRPMLLVYNANDKAITYLQSGVRIEVQGVWYIVNSTDKNDRVQIIPATSASYNKWVHLVTDNATTLGNTSYAALLASNILVNPYTGQIDATKLLEDGEALEDKYALKGEGGSGGASLSMPVIRVLTVADVDRTGVIGPSNPLRITIATEGGVLRDDDEIQLCSRKAFTYKVCDEREDATRVRGRRWKYRKIRGRSAEECHPDKSMEKGIYRMICWDIGDDITPRAFLRSDNRYQSGRVVTKYVRVARLCDNDTYIHSNVVPIQFTVRDLVMPDKNEAKINVR